LHQFSFLRRHEYIEKHVQQNIKFGNLYLMMAETNGRNMLQ